MQNEINQLYELIESSITEDLHTVKQEFAQIKSLISDASATLTKSFYDVNHNAQQQHNQVQRLIESQPSGDHQQIISQINDIADKIKTNAADAVRSLQFEDIAVQVADNGIQYLDNIEVFLSQCKTQLDTLFNLEFQKIQTTDQLQSFADAIRQLRQNRPPVDRKAAKQQDLSEGDVELF